MSGLPGMVEQIGGQPRKQSPRKREPEEHFDRL
jgi:hypothetical protein